MTFRTHYPMSYNIEYSAHELHTVFLSLDRKLRFMFQV